MWVSAVHRHVGAVHRHVGAVHRHVGAVHRQLRAPLLVVAKSRGVEVVGHPPCIT